MSRGQYYTGIFLTRARLSKETCSSAKPVLNGFSFYKAVNVVISCL